MFISSISSAGSSSAVDHESPSLESKTDTELVQSFLAGDQAAFNEIVQRHTSKVFNVAFRMLRNHADAEEITQDTFIRAHRNLHTFRGDASLGTWLHRVALNLARNRYWYFFRRRQHLTLSLDCPAGENGNGTVGDLFSSNAANPAQESAREEYVALITECLQRLEPRHRAVLTMRNLQNCTYDDIAAELGINPGTVKSRIARARARLRADLAEACPDFSVDTAPGEWFERVRDSGQLACA